MGRVKKQFMQRATKDHSKQAIGYWDDCKLSYVSCARSITFSVQETLVLRADLRASCVIPPTNYRKPCLSGDVHHSGIAMSNSTRGSIGDTQLAKSSVNFVPLVLQGRNCHFLIFGY